MCVECGHPDTFESVIDNFCTAEFGIVFLRVTSNAGCGVAASGVSSRNEFAMGWDMGYLITTVTDLLPSSTAKEC